jgi:Tfp pilus assembly protein PilN
MALKLFSKAQVTIAIEDSVLRILLVKDRKVQAWMNYPLPPELSQEEVEKDPRQYQRLLSFLFFGRENLKSQTMVSIPGTRALFNTITLPRLKEKLVAEAVTREARRQLSVGVDQAYLFWQAFNTTKEKQDFLSVAVLKTDYDRVYNLLKGAKLEPRLWDLKPLALVRAVGREQGIILDLEHDNIDLILVNQGVPVIVRTLSEPTDVPHEVLAAQLANYVSETLAYYDNSQEGDTQDMQNAPVVLTGELTSRPGLVEAIRAASYLQVDQFQSPIEAPPEFPAASYAAALGLALKNGRSGKDKVGSQPIDFDVCPEEYRKPAVEAKTIATVASIFIGIGLLFPVWQMYDAGSAELANKRTELAPIQRQVSLAAADLALQSEAQEQINQTMSLVYGLEDDLDTVLSTGRDMAENLHGTLDAQPSGVYLRSYSSSSQDSVLSLSGDASDYDAVLSYTESLESGANFSEVTVNSLTQQAGGDEDVTVSFNLTVDKESLDF